MCTGGQCVCSSSVKEQILKASKITKPHYEMTSRRFQIDSRLQHRRRGRCRTIEVKAWICDLRPGLASPLPSAVVLCTPGKIRSPSLLFCVPWFLLSRPTWRKVSISLFSPEQRSASNISLLTHSYIAEPLFTHMTCGSRANIGTHSCRLQESYRRLDHERVIKRLPYFLL